MKEKIIIVSNKMGLHARPAAMLVQTASKYKSSVKIIKDDFVDIDAKSIMGIMSLAARQGSQLKFIADGPDENEVLTELESLFKSNFSE
ncbi:MAG: HPr family phosphocarrier protein [Endomicrobium sp.]|jgi:phosphocarrier protein|nr:HPr family phosphocarrier protein [Endomicrobium sp.]